MDVYMIVLVKLYKLFILLLTIFTKNNNMKYLTVSLLAIASLFSSCRKNEKTEEEVDSCLAGLYACHSILICKGTRVRFFLDTMGKLFNGKLSATYNLIDTLPSQPISDISSEREKSINKLAKQTQFQFQQKKNIIEVYKLIYKLHLVVHEKNTIEDANSITELEFLKLSKILPSDLSNEYLIDELFSNLTASSYFSYRHLFLNH